MVEIRRVASYTTCTGSGTGELYDRWPKCEPLVRASSSRDGGVDEMKFAPPSNRTWTEPTKLFSIVLLYAVLVVVSAG